MPTCSHPRALVIALSLALAAVGCSSGSVDAGDDVAGRTTITTPSTTTDAEGGGGPESTTAPEVSDDDIVAHPPAKSWEEALAAARGKFDGQVSKIELEQRGRGRYEYKIELVEGRTKSAVQYDANSLEELSSKTDSKDSANTVDLSEVISLEDAARLARTERNGTIVEWKLEAKDTYSQYEFEIRAPGTSDDEEVEIDATDGSVRS